jgi:hypothetical protein
MAAMLAEGQELDSNILLSPVRRTRIFTEGVAVRRLGDRVIGNRAGITASLRVREGMSAADRAGFVSFSSPGRRKCHRHEERSDQVERHSCGVPRRPPTPDMNGAWHGTQARLALYHVAKAALDYRAQAICFLMNVPPEQGACQLDKPKIRGDSLDKIAP